MADKMGIPRNEILAMKPGRELDALVAEKVMGWYKVRLMTSGRRTDYEGFPPGVYGSTKVKKYSTDIAAAWEAETKVIENDPSMYVHALASVVFGYCQVQDISDIRKMCMLIHATPEQRCKAALLAVMENGR